MSRRLALQRLLALAGAAFAPSLAAQLTSQLPHIKRGLVAVGAHLPTRSPAFQFRGTGFAVGDGQLIATNAHVLPPLLKVEANERLVVALPGAQPALRAATQVAHDPVHDLVLLHIEGEPLPALRLGDSARLSEGQELAFSGFPIGTALGLHPATHRALLAAITPVGIPAGNARELNARRVHALTAGAFDIFQLDATAYPGNSGSPLFDPQTGQVVGIVNMVFVKGSKENTLTNPSGIAYAIPAQYLQQLLESLRDRQ